MSYAQNSFLVLSYPSFLWNVSHIMAGMSYLSNVPYCATNTDLCHFLEWTQSQDTRKRAYNLLKYLGIWTKINCIKGADLKSNILAFIEATNISIWLLVVQLFHTPSCCRCCWFCPLHFVSFLTFLMFLSLL